MEAVYLKDQRGYRKTQTPTWCSKKITFKTYFKEYSDELKGVFKSNKSNNVGLTDFVGSELDKDLDDIIKTFESPELFFTNKSFKTSVEKNKTASKKNFSLNPEPGPSTSHSYDNPTSSSKEISVINIDLTGDVSEGVRDTEGLDTHITKTQRIKRKNNSSKAAYCTNMKSLQVMSVKRFQKQKSLQGSSDVGKSFGIKKGKKTTREYLAQPLKDKVSETLLPDTVFNGINDHSQTPAKQGTEQRSRKKAEGHQEEKTKKKMEGAHGVSNKKRIEESQEANHKRLDAQDDDECNETLPSSSKHPRKPSIGPLLALVDDYKKANKGKTTDLSTGLKKKRMRRGQIFVDAMTREGKKDLIPRENFVVSFRVHKPFMNNVGQKGYTGKCLQEIDVLNFQTLDDLRESICCEADYQNACGDVSNNPNSPAPLAKDKYKGGMFYIGNTFYVDNRPGSEDYSTVIREWGRSSGIDLGDTKPMDEMKVEDLEVRFGYPYVYKHQGSCEHLIIISNARLLRTNDSLHSSDYPAITKISKSQTVYCATCLKTPANWIVHGSDRMIRDINVMCDGCFKSYHYIDGKKVGNFKASPWLQRALLFA